MGVGLGVRSILTSAFERENGFAAANDTRKDLHEFFSVEVRPPFRSSVCNHGKRQFHAKVAKKTRRSEAYSARLSSAARNEIWFTAKGQVRLKKLIIKS